MTKTSNLKKGLIVTGKTREAVAGFLKNLLARKLTEAERVLETVRNRKFTNEKYKKGYVNALEGMLLSSRSGDNRDFYNRGDFSKENLKKFKDEFNFSMNDITRNSFDTGYFSAWSDLIQYLSNLQEQSKL